MSRFAILLGGNLTSTPRLRRQIAGARFIAADNGMVHAKTLGIVPELWVGDFDSSGSELLLDYREVKRQIHPADKDATDGEIAVQTALASGASDILLLGSLGGRTDHVTAHLGLALRLAGEGVRCLLSNGDEEAYPLIAGEHSFNLAPGSQFSVVPWSDVSNFTLRNVKWPLDDVKLKLGSSLTMSNVARGHVSLSFTAGIAMAFAVPTGSD